ncbi:hypothetical protein BT69DRAFT_872025 [Atractiella rhizophila]|nr:hypothetical protein BT69DRAFT_872025 [Atractiella rhizophila]
MRGSTSSSPLLFSPSLPCSLLQPPNSPNPLPSPSRLRRRPSSKRSLHWEKENVETYLLFLPLLRSLVFPPKAKPCRQNQVFLQHLERSVQRGNPQSSSGHPGKNRGTRA